MASTTSLIRLTSRLAWRSFGALRSVNKTQVAHLSNSTKYAMANGLLAQRSVILNRVQCLSDAPKFSKAQIEEKVLEILKNFDRVKENPAKPQVTLTSHLMKDLGLDSLDQVEVIVQLEDAFGYEIPDSDYEKLVTPTEIVKYIEARLAKI